MRASCVDVAVALFADGQVDHVAHWQMLDLGSTEKAIRVRVARGGMWRTHHGVYVLGTPSVTPAGARMGAVLAGGPLALLGYRDAAWRYNARQRNFGPVEIVLPPGTGSRSRPGILVHRRRLPDPWPRIVDGIPTTSPEQMLLDCACVLRPSEVSSLVRRTAKLDLLDRRRIEHLLARGRPKGGPLIRAALAELPIVGGSDTELEDRFHLLMHRGGVMPFARQILVLGHRADAVLERLKICIELDGRDHLTELQVRADKALDRSRTLAGWLCLRFGWDEVVGNPEQVLADVRIAIASRLAQL